MASRSNRMRSAILSHNSSLHHHLLMGTKRDYDGQPVTAESQITMAESNPIIPIFETFRNELDEHHDRRERIIKTSRDITALSKKM